MIDARTPPPPSSHRAFRPRAALALLLGALAAGCSSNAPLADPLAAIAHPEEGPHRVKAGMAQLDADPQNPEYIQALKRMIHRPGYTVDVREAAVERLEHSDPEGLKETIALNLPRLDSLQWRRRLCEIIAEKGWTDLSTTLVRAWAVQVPGWVERDSDRPERKALERLHGKENLSDYLFQTFVEADAVREQNLRARCWELLHTLGQRDRLVELLTASNVNPQDAMLADLRAAARELGVVPHNREEILWVMHLRDPSRAEFWSQAVQATQSLSPERRAAMEIRDLPVAVAALLHRPELLSASNDELYRQALSKLKGQKHHFADFEGWEGAFPARIEEFRNRLTWGDLAAIHLALQALAVPQVVGHLFDYAERDRKDTGAEFGGIVRLDAQGRFEVVEFPPRNRISDERFDSSQEMMDAGYTSLFHFHNHSMRYDNGRYAGPHMGDFTYAQSTRTNCLVFTFIDQKTLNADYYRHGQVVVDLGSITRP